MRITETERSVRSEQPVQLQREIWHFMRRNSAEKRAERAEAARLQADESERFRAIVRDLARAHHQLRVFLAHNAAALAQAGLGQQADLLDTIHDRYGQVLTRAGAELLYFDGQPFTFALMDSVTITASIPTENVGQRVIRETVSPGVRLGSELVSKAEVQLAVPVPASMTNDPSDPATGGA